MVDDCTIIIVACDFYRLIIHRTYISFKLDPKDLLHGIHHYGYQFIQAGAHFLYCIVQFYFCIGLYDHHIHCCLVHTVSTVPYHSSHTSEITTPCPVERRRWLGDHVACSAHCVGCRIASGGDEAAVRTLWRAPGAVGAVEVCVVRAGECALTSPAERPCNRCFALETVGVLY